MKNNIIIAAGVAAGTAIITYLIRRRKINRHTPNMPIPKAHHSTMVFSNAKNRLIQSVN